MANSGENSIQSKRSLNTQTSEGQMRVLDRAAISLQDKVTERAIAQMRLAVRSIQQDPGIEGRGTVLAIADGIERRLAGLPGTGRRQRDVVGEVLAAVDALRVLHEEIASTTGARADVESFAISFRASASPGNGHGLPGDGMAA